MSYHRISILGCGWLGFPLGRRLIQQNHFVRGSTTTKEKIPILEEAGIEPYYLQLDPRMSGDDITSFFDVDTVVLNIPPPRSEDRLLVMAQQAEELISYINNSPVRRMIMVSSTGVYAGMHQDADETDPHPPETENGKGLAAMEQQFMERLQASVAVVRMAGLIGPGRNPGRFLRRGTSSRNPGAAGADTSRSDSPAIRGNGTEPVNLIHLEDAMGVVIALIRSPELTGIYNACAQEHPTRKEFYSKASEQLGFTPPVFSDQESRPWKRIISEKIRRATGYTFVYDNPIDSLKKSDP